VISKKNSGTKNEKNEEIVSTIISFFLPHMKYGKVLVVLQEKLEKIIADFHVLGHSPVTCHRKT
jgi:hypothetical protein